MSFVPQDSSNITTFGSAAGGEVPGSDISSPTRSTAGLHFHRFITYEFLLSSTVSFAVGLLTLWHARLIHRGETSIEVHINIREAKRFRSKGMVRLPVFPSTDHIGHIGYSSCPDMTLGCQTPNKQHGILTWSSQTKVFTKLILGVSRTGWLSGGIM